MPHTTKANMKDTPIFIISKDRFTTLKAQVEHYQKRGYNNITIVDNLSTYPPLLEWYKTCGVTVFVNTITKPINHAMWALAVDLKVPQFHDVMANNWYVFNDSDVVPVDEAPDDFIDQMIEIAEKHKMRKVGCALKLDDLPAHFHRRQEIINWEARFWSVPIRDEKAMLYRAEIDSTFGVCRPGTWPGWSEVHETLRVDMPFAARHIPWYYDYDNLPEDEKYYLEHLEANMGPVWSWKVKHDIIKK